MLVAKFEVDPSALSCHFFHEGKNKSCVSNTAVSELLFLKGGNHYGSTELMHWCALRSVPGFN